MQIQEQIQIQFVQLSVHSIIGWEPFKHYLADFYLAHCCAIFLVILILSSWATKWGDMAFGALAPSFCKKYASMHPPKICQKIQKWCFCKKKTKRGLLHMDQKRLKLGKVVSLDEKFLCLVKNILRNWGYPPWISYINWWIAFNLGKLCDTILLSCSEVFCFGLR